MIRLAGILDMSNWFVNLWKRIWGWCCRTRLGSWLHRTRVRRRARRDEKQACKNERLTYELRQQGFDTVLKSVVLATEGGLQAWAEKYELRAHGLDDGPLCLCLQDLHDRGMIEITGEGQRHKYFLSAKFRPTSMGRTKAKDLLDKDPTWKIYALPTVLVVLALWLVSVFALKYLLAQTDRFYAAMSFSRRRSTGFS